MKPMNPSWRVVYLLAITVGVFWTEAPVIISILLLLQIVLWLYARLPAGELLRTAWRLKFFFLLFIIVYLYPSSGDTNARMLSFRVSSFSINLSLTGLYQSLVMCMRVLTVVFTSMVARRTGRQGPLAAKHARGGGSFVDGMKALGLPEFLGYTLDGTLRILAETPESRRLGKRKGMRQGKSSSIKFIKKILSGDLPFLSFLSDTIGKTIARTGTLLRKQRRPGKPSSYYQDLSVVTGMAVVMMSLKILKVIPGMPVAPGWKNVLFIPLMVLSSELTTNGWGGTLAGSTMGIVAFMFGDGKYGIFEVFQHITPGVLVDLMWPMFKKGPRSMVLYGALGFIASVGKFATIVAVLLFMESRAAVYAVLFPFGIPHLAFGALSGIVTYYLIGSVGSIRKTAGLIYKNSG